MRGDGKVKLFMMVGLPGSGKSTHIQSIETELKKRKQKYVIVSPDSIREELTGSVGDQSKNKEVFDVAFSRLRENLAKRVTVIFDSCAVSKKSRSSLLKIAKSKKAYSVAVVVDVKLSTALKQNAGRERKVPDDVIKRFHRTFVMPTLDEGFDQVTRVAKKTDIKNVI